MFERELMDCQFVKRWGIVRTLVPQSVAEHTFLVAHYANDICVLLSMPPAVCLAVLRYALWHDVDEIYTSDLPGPSKRKLLPGDAREAWDRQLDQWSDFTFERLPGRSGVVDGDNPAAPMATAKKIIKIADWLEASTRMATETQMGNGCTARHIEPNLRGAIAAARHLGVWLNRVEAVEHLITLMAKAVEDALTGQSHGPWITNEDETR